MTLIDLIFIKEENTSSGWKHRTISTFFLLFVPKSCYMYVDIVCFVCNMGQIVNGHLEENIRDVVLHAPIFSEDPNKNLENESSIFHSLFA